MTYVCMPDAYAWGVVGMQKKPMRSGAAGASDKKTEKKKEKRKGLGGLSSEKKKLLKVSGIIIMFEY